MGNSEVGSWFFSDLLHCEIYCCFFSPSDISSYFKMTCLEFSFLRSICCTPHNPMWNTAGQCLCLALTLPADSFVSRVHSCGSSSQSLLYRNVWKWVPFSIHMCHDPRSTGTTKALWRLGGGLKLYCIKHTLSFSYTISQLWCLPERGFKHSWHWLVCPDTSDTFPLMLPEPCERDPLILPAAWRKHDRRLVPSISVLLK